MADEFDLDEFLKDFDLGDKADAVKQVLSTDANKKKLQGAVLRQSEFDKKMNAAKHDLSIKLGELETKQKSLDDLITKNIAYKGEADKAVQAEIAKAQKEVNQLRGKAVKAAELAGYSLDEIDAEEIAPRKPEIDLEALKKEIAKDSVSPAMLDRLATGHINLSLDLDDVKDTYQELYGKHITRAQKEELLVEFGKDLNKDQTAKIITTADRLFKFGEKREEGDKARVAKLLEDARADERAKITKEMSDQGLPAPRRTGPISPIAIRTRKEGEKPTEGRGIALALEHLNKQRAGASA